MAGICIFAKPTSSSLSHYSFSIGDYFPRIMASPASGVCWSRFLKIPTLSVPHHRQISNGMGNLLGLIQDLGPLVSGRALVAHQCQSAQGSSPDLQGIPNPCSRQVHVSLYRQHNSHVLYQQTGRSTLFSPVPRGTSLMGILHSPLDSPQGNLLPGSQNQLADHLSRVFSNHYKWSIRLEILQVIFRKWGTPQIDPFATRCNRKCLQFCPFLGHSPGSLTDVFLLSWTGLLFYAFSSIPLIHKGLLRIRWDRAGVILIALAWPRQHWFMTLLNLSVETQI